MDDSDKEPSEDSSNENKKIKSSKQTSNETENLLMKDRDSLTYSSNLVNEGINAGKRIAKISVITLLGIGIVEILTGYFSGSIVAFADGIDSISDAMISFIVLLGLRIAHKPADKRFHFGYHKVESLTALMAAIGMIVIGIIIFYNSYQSLIQPHEIKEPILVMTVLAGASALSLHRAFQMRKIANKYNLLSLKTDARNSIKDGSASVIGFFSILVATQFGIIQMDAIGGMIIAGYIFSVSYITLKRSSLVLVDSWQNPQITEKIKETISNDFKNDDVDVKHVLLRSSGMVDQAEIHIEASGDERLSDIELLSLRIEMAIRSKYPSLEKVSIIPHSSSDTADKSKLTRINTLRSLKWKPSVFRTDKKSKLLK